MSGGQGGYPTLEAGGMKVPVMGGRYLTLEAGGMEVPVKGPDPGCRCLTLLESYIWINR